jgi:hypothetical protein
VKDTLKKRGRRNEKRNRMVMIKKENKEGKGWMNEGRKQKKTHFSLTCELHDRNF